MCGIVCMLGENPKINVINGLYMLENRGYDSCGISFLNNNKKFNIFKKNNIKSLEKEVKENFNGESINSIGHTRWATHGIIDIKNSHPHLSMDNKFCIVHNGIIENIETIKEILNKHNYIQKSDTDTEIIVNLLSHYYHETNNDIYNSLDKLKNILEGSYAFCIQHEETPDIIYSLCKNIPLLVGYNNDSLMIVSEISALDKTYVKYIDQQDDKIYTYKYKNNKIMIPYENHTIKSLIQKHNNILSEEDWTIQEIKEQPSIIDGIISRHIVDGKITFDGIFDMSKIEHIILLGCGTSFNTCCIGKHYLKKYMSNIYVDAIDGSEFTIKDVPHKGEVLYIFVSQSGETKDLHKCITLIGKSKKIGIINTEFSYISKKMDYVCYLGAGKEIGVASTKSFTSQLTMLSLLSMYISKTIIPEKDLYKLPNDIYKTLETNINSYKIINNNCYVLGSGIDIHVAYEGALKIKELSYIHAEGYSSSSLKHGPFALLDEQFCVILIQPDNEFYNKNENIYHEIISRKSNVIIITNKKDMNKKNVIYVEKNDTYQEILNIIPLQLMSYYLSKKNNINPDKPRNLAKVVTVL